MSVLGAGEAFMLGAADEADAYVIPKSLRFNSGDSAHLSKTFASTGNRRTWTWSAWVKLDGASGAQNFFATYNGSYAIDSFIQFYYDGTSHTFNVYQGSSLVWKSTQVLRDPAAWYHLVIAFDTTQSTADDRLKVYVNSKQLTRATGAGFSQNTEYAVNNNIPHRIGTYSGSTEFFKGLMADIQFVDGQQLAPTDFGETRSSDGVWVPKEFTGDYNAPAVGVVYSDGVSSPQGIQSSYPATNAFDGSTSTACTNVTTNGSPTLTVTFNPPLTNVTSLRMYTGNIGSNQYATGYGLVNGTSISHTTLGASYGTAWVDFTGHFSGTTVNSMGLGQTNAGTYALGLSINAIEVNGTILTDGTAAGVNGFHLNFSDSSTNEALGFDSAPTTPDPDPKKGMDVVTYTGDGTSNRQIGGLSFEPGLVWIKRRNSTAKDHCLVDVVRGPKKRLRIESTAQETTEEVVTAFDPGGFTIGNDTGVNQSGGYNYVAWAWAAGGPAVSNTSGSINAEVSANTDYGFSIVKWTANNSYATIGHGLTSQTPKFILVKSTASGTNWVVYHHSLGNTKGLNINLSGTGSTAQDYWNDTSPTTSVFSVGNFANYQTAAHVAYVWSEISNFSKFGSYTGNGSTTGPTITTGFKPRFVIIKNVDNTGNWRLYDTERDATSPSTTILFANTNAAESTTAHPVRMLNDGFQIEGTHSDINTSGETYIYAAWADRPGNNWDVNNIVTNEGLAANKDNFDILTYTGNASTQKFSGGADFSGTATITYDGTPDTSYTTGETSAMFDGSTSTAFGVNNGSSNKFVNIAFATGITVSSSLKVHAAFRTGMVWTVNGNTVTSSGVSHPNTGLQTLNFTGTMNSLRCEVANGNALEIHLIEVDGIPLLDGTGPGLKFQPDFVWIKSRSNPYNHYLWDSVRGATKYLMSHVSDAEATMSNGLISFNSDGFTLGSDSNINYTNRTMVAWCWKAGGAAVSNTDGSITSSVSANPSGSFSIVTYTGTGSAATVGHGLSNPPSLIIVKQRNGTDSWAVDSRPAGANGYLSIEDSSALNTSVSPWNNTDPTSSVFSIAAAPGNNAINRVNLSGKNYVAYCFANVSGHQRVGQYTGTGTSSGPTVITGFKPKLVVTKCTSTDNGYTFWEVYDSERPNILAWDINDAEGSGNLGTGTGINFLDNGFQIAAVGSGKNLSGQTYMYLAIGDDEIGSDEDCLVDVPNAVTADADATDTTGGYQRGNYCTLNPLNKSDTATISNGNLSIVDNVDTDQTTGTIAVSSGKYYFETTITTHSGTQQDGLVGISDVNRTNFEEYVGKGAYSYGIAVAVYNTYMKKYNGNTAVDTDLTPPGLGDTIGVAFDLDNGKIFFHKNGVYANNGNPATGGNPAYTGISGTFTPAITCSGSTGGTVGHNLNFGQMRFKYPIPSGYAALNTTALPPATIEDGSAHFEAKLYTGNGSTQQITGFEFSPDLVWLKSRSNAYGHILVDTVRGAGKELYSHSTDQEETPAAGNVSSFNSDGFTLASRTGINANNATFVGWAWDAGSSTVSNTDGSVTSQVRVNQTAKFSIVSWTSSNSANGTYDTIGHGLNALPGLVITKRRDTADAWYSAHGFDLTQFGKLNSTDAFSSAGTAWGNGITSSVIGMRIGNFVGANEAMIAYCFAPVAGYSAFGTYEGNGSNDGPFVYTGFAPAFLVFRRYNGAGDWIIFDNKRNDHDGNYREKVLYPNKSNAEETSANGDTMLFLSNGFKLNNVNYAYWNANGDDYLWAAFAENPFQANGGLAR